MTSDSQEPLESAHSTSESSQEAATELNDDASNGTTAEPIQDNQAETIQESHLESSSQTTVSRKAPSPLPYVSWGGRVLAYLIDVLPILIVVALANLLVNVTETTSLEVIGRNGRQDITVEVTQTSTIGILIEVVTFIAILIYWFWNKGYREGTGGKSIGKQVLGFTTIDEATGRQLGTKKSCIRVLLLFVDFFICYIGVLWPLWDVRKQTFLSDRFTNAIVIRD